MVCVQTGANMVKGASLKRNSDSGSVVGECAGEINLRWLVVTEFRLQVQLNVHDIGGPTRVVNGDDSCRSV